MSLLLDALKRAEQAKQAKSGEAQDSAGVQTAAAIQQPAPAASGAPSPRSLQLEEINVPKPQYAALQGTPPEPQRESAKNVFAAKQPSSISSRSWLFPVLGSAILVVGAGGWYVWSQVNKLSPTSTSRAPVAPAPITQAPHDVSPPRPDTGQIPSTTPSASDKTSAPSAPAAASVPFPEHVASAKPSSSASERAREALIRNLKDATPAKESPLSLKMTTGIEPPRVSAELAGAYSALRSGNYAEARKLYNQVLAGDPLNLDAHLGLATALARTGDVAGATREYRKALEIDPRNSTALAGLLVVSDQSNLGTLETDLKILMAKTPNSAPLSFALGNVYAAQSRWTEAQQAYFDAFRFEPENPDYIYNLAVSLDQLKQPKLALDYYQRALAAAGKGGSQFDRAQAARRANELKSAS